MRSAPADGVGCDEVAHPARALGVVAGRADELDELLPRFDRFGHGLRITLDEAAERRRRGDALARGLVELGRAPQRLALDLDRPVAVGDALELARGARAVAGFDVRDGELRRHVGRELVIRERAAEILEHRRRTLPIAELNQRGAGVVLGRRAHGRRRRGLRHAQEVIDGDVELAGRARLLALLVDRRRDALRDLAALRVVAGHERRELHVGRLGGREILQIELGMRHDGPRRALQRRLDRRRARDDLPADIARAAELAEREQFLGGVGLHGRGLRVRRIRFGESQAAVDAAAVPIGRSLPRSSSSCFAYASSAA